MNEDDTARRLKRIPYQELERFYFEQWNNMPMTDENRHALFESHGWTWDEFIAIWKWEYK